MERCNISCFFAVSSVESCKYPCGGRRHGKGIEMAEQGLLDTPARPVREGYFFLCEICDTPHEKREERRVGRFKLCLDCWTEFEAIMAARNDERGQSGQLPDEARSNKTANAYFYGNG